ncbi:hypothetical protein MF672_033370 [Actinomadura sp. ATCC 31491]|uniref:Uncharacterized protein n=1 Tax=Actinomadura luzonensis TaxID=2805427 RepID=A0ABT0G218_9ACTN|nr:hypothetical protein [Actinomadura luzonensis]MCK2218651.1 hypothetical protein [Actinomadura luzonensis]
MDISLTIDSANGIEELESLVDWLSEEKSLRGRVRLRRAVPAPGEMGAMSETALVAVSSGGALTALMTSLRAWLAQPHRSDVRVKIRKPDGTLIEVDAKNVDGRRVEKALRSTLLARHEE